MKRLGKVRSHLIPRTSVGRTAVALFLVLFALTQPPAVYLFANRVQPWILGLPFLYAYLLVLYFLLIAVLLWARRRNL
jgi:Ca2+/Na+ antiporter